MRLVGKWRTRRRENRQRGKQGNGRRAALSAPLSRTTYALSRLLRSSTPCLTAANILQLRSRPAKGPTTIFSPICQRRKLLLARIAFERLKLGSRRIALGLHVCMRKRLSLRWTDRYCQEVAATVGRPLDYVLVVLASAAILSPEYASWHDLAYLLVSKFLVSPAKLDLQRRSWHKDNRLSGQRLPTGICQGITPAWALDFWGSSV